MTGWPLEEQQKFLRMQFSAQHTYYQEHYSDAAFELILVDGEPAGRLYLQRRSDEHRVVDIALLPPFRGRGIGGAIMRQILDEADKLRLPVRIHVEHNNPAKHLYDRLGFTTVDDTGVYCLMERLPRIDESPQSSSPNRRAFLQNASLVTVVASGFAGASMFAVAEDVGNEAGNPADTNAASHQVKKLDLGVKPTVGTAGAVLVPRIRNTYVTFHATQYGEDGNVGVEGTAVIELAVCVQRKFRSKGDEATAEHAIDLESLEPCEAYEVLDSSWAAKWNGITGEESQQEGDVRHLIFTFLGFCPGVCAGAMHFECLAADAQVHFLQDASFDDVLLYIDLLETSS